MSWSARAGQRIAAATLLGIGYGRAARLIDFMAEDGIVGQYNGSQAREIIISLEQWAEMSGSGREDRAAEPPKRNNTIMLAPPAEGARPSRGQVRLPTSLRKTRRGKTKRSRTTTKNRKTKRTMIDDEEDDEEEKEEYEGR